MNLAAVPTSLFVVAALLFLEGTARNILTTNHRKVAINGPVCGSLVASCRHGAIIKNRPMWAVRVKTPPSLINVPRSALLGETKKSLCCTDCTTQRASLEVRLSSMFVVFSRRRSRLAASSEFNLVFSRRCTSWPRCQVRYCDSSSHLKGPTC